MNIQETYEAIKNWQAEVQEDFNDYFSHDSIDDYHWAFYLIGKGYEEHGNIILRQKAKSKYSLSQQLLYCIYPEYLDSGWIQENYEKNIMIMAEFLVSSDMYLRKFEEFLKRDV